MGEDDEINAVINLYKGNWREEEDVVKGLFELMMVSDRHKVYLAVYGGQCIKEYVIFYFHIFCKYQKLFKQKNKRRAC